MLAVLEKELRSFFSSLTGPIVIAVYLIICVSVMIVEKYIAILRIVLFFVKIANGSTMNATFDNHSTIAKPVGIGFEFNSSCV